MRYALLTAAASALCLAATPALAQAISDDDANAMVSKLTTPAFDACTESDESKQLAAQQQYSACQTALAELKQTRRSNPRATAGEKEVYLFMESMLEMGHTVSLLRIDQAPTARVCGNIERQWVLATSSNPAVAGPELKDAQTSTREGVRDLVKLCRAKFPAPAGAPAA
jgi:hypothetical protein